MPKFNGSGTYQGKMQFPMPGPSKSQVRVLNTRVIVIHDVMRFHPLGHVIIQDNTEGYRGVRKLNICR